jgi:hypothetical protein
MKSKLEKYFICSLNEWILGSLIILLQLHSFIVSDDNGSINDRMIMKDHVVVVVCFKIWSSCSFGQTKEIH